MAEKITDSQVDDLLAILRSDATVDAKVQQLNAIKSGIKQHNVPDACVPSLFEALRAASSAQHAVLVNAGFTALNHLLTRLSRQEPKLMTKEAARTLPLIVEKLGDQKEKFRTLALQCLGTLYKTAPVDVERSVRNIAMAGKNPRAKEASLQWLLQMHQENGLQFRSYVPTLMELLEDADGMVRDTAKSTVIELFRNAPNAAKSDLKRQLKNFKVRPAIEQAIVKELVPTISSAAASSQIDGPDEAAVPARPNFAASVSSISSERPITPMADAPADPVEPMYVNTQRELDDIFKEMHLYFDGKETEQNWLKREESITKLRRLLAGNAPSDLHDSFLVSLRGLLDGIMKGITSLRTSLSKESCLLVQEMARTFGPGMDPMVELLMQTFIKLSAATKKIASQNANVTVDTIIGKVTYNARIMQHVWGACQDKNVQPRSYATGWLKTIINKEAHHKSHFEHAGGLEMVDKCIKKGLTDANPGVRENMRATYWTFAGIWPARAEAIMNGLDATAQKLLQNDPHNPNSNNKRTEAGPPRPGLGFSKSTMSSGKPSLRETMLAQKRALASRNLPARPGSAMAHFSPVRTVSTTSNMSAATTTSVRTRPESTLASGGGGLSGAPMRPTRKRPEIAARPATAGPYSVRSHDQPSAEQASPPEKIRPKAAITPRNMGTSPKRTTVQRTRTGHAANGSESSIATPSKLTAPKTAMSPRISPAREKHPSPPKLATSSPIKALEDFTLVVPPVPSVKTSPKPSPEVAPAEPIQVERTEASTSSRTLKVYEDPLIDAQTTPKPSKPTPVRPVLEDKAVNEDAASLQLPSHTELENGVSDGPLFSPDKAKQNTRLLESAIAKVKAKALDVHGFRKLQSIIRDSKSAFAEDKFHPLVTGLFEFLESPLSEMAPEKVQDVKAQILATIRLLLKRMRASFQRLVSQGLQSLLRARAVYDGRTHIVSGLELLADELVTLGDASEITQVLSSMLAATDMEDVAGRRTLSFGLHVLKQTLDAPGTGGGFVPSDAELATLAGLAARCLESTEPGVRMDAVQLCVALHACVGDVPFWDAVKGVQDDPKSLITYYIVKRQREAEAAVATPAAVLVL